MNNNWIHSTVRLNTPVQLSKYLEIWDALASLQMVPWLQMVPCNILVSEARNREEINVCIVFMHRKSGEFCAFK
jgi:hypothetical protein